MTPGRLQAFYDRWYRPENAAVTVVGDLPLDVLEQKVRATFGDWTPRGPAGMRAARDAPSSPRGLDLQVETNPGLPAVSGICRVTPADPDGPPEARLHALLLRGLWEAILQRRIETVKSRRDAPFVAATITDEARPDSLKICVGIVPVPGQEIRAIAIIQTELRRFAAEGPTAEETDAGLEQVRASVRGADRRSAPRLARPRLPGARTGHGPNAATRAARRAAGVRRLDGGHRSRRRPRRVRQGLGWLGPAGGSDLAAAAAPGRRPGGHDRRGRQMSRALRTAGAGLRRGPRLASTRAGMARAADVTDLARTADAYRTQLKADPNRPDLRAALGETLERMGDPAGAMAEYDKAIHGPGDSHRALIDRGHLLVSQGRFDDGRKDFNRALSINPKDVEALTARGASWVAEGKGKKAPAAMADFNAALAIRPNDAAALNARGNLYLAELKPELALADFNKALAANPKDDVVLFNRGVAFKQLNRYDSALRDFNAVLRITPGDPMTLAAKGDAYRQLGDLLLARQFYDAALKADPGNAVSWEARGEIRAALGDGAGGDADKAQARKLNPSIEASS